VVVDDYLLVADDRGTASCFDTRTGDRHWRARLGSGFSASLVHGNNRVYFIANDGTTKIVEPGREFRLLCENPLGERVSASPAISDGQLFIRGQESLFCIGQSTSRSRPSADPGTTEDEH
jgi:outer membrane protein assembly factor BamB